MSNVIDDTYKFTENTTLIAQYEKLETIFDKPYTFPSTKLTADVFNNIINNPNYNNITLPKGCLTAWDYGRENYYIYDNNTPKCLKFDGVRYAPNNEVYVSCTTNLPFQVGNTYYYIHWAAYDGTKYSTLVIHDSKILLGFVFTTAPQLIRISNLLLEADSVLIFMSKGLTKKNRSYTIEIDHRWDIHGKLTFGAETGYGEFTWFAFVNDKSRNKETGCVNIWPTGSLSCDDSASIKIYDKYDYYGVPNNTKKYFSNTNEETENPIPFNLHGGIFRCNFEEVTLKDFYAYSGTIKIECPTTFVTGYISDDIVWTTDGNRTLKLGTKVEISEAAKTKIKDAGINLVISDS